MAPEQFKAWSEGFCETIVEAPTPEQWAKIKAKVAEIREKLAVTLRDTDFRRTWVDTTLQNDVERIGPLVVRGDHGYGTGRRLPDRGHAIATCGPSD